MSYDLAARHDEIYSTSMARQTVYEIILDIPNVRPNGATGFILEQGESIHMEVDVCLVTEEGDILEETDSPSSQVNCINFHIPAGSADGLESCIATARRIAYALDWELYDAQEDMVLGSRPKGRLDGSQGSPPAHQGSSAKPPLEPKWAVAFSLIAILGGIVAVAVAHALLLVPLTTALLRYAIVTYLTVGFSWASLERRTHKAAIRANNAFVIFTVCLLGVLIVVQDEHEAFPEWATALLVVAGIAGYSVMGIHGVRNFRRWRRDDYRAS